MSIQIRTPESAPEDAAQEALVSLHAWLREDAATNRTTELALRHRRTPGMGSVVDLVDMVLGQGFNAANFALAYAAWRRSRSRREPAPPLAFTRTESGRSVVVGDASEESLERLRRLLDEAEGRPEGDDRGDA